MYPCVCTSCEMYSMLCLSAMHRLPRHVGFGHGRCGGRCVVLRERQDLWQLLHVSLLIQAISLHDGQYPLRIHTYTSSLSIYALLPLAVLYTYLCHTHTHTHLPPHTHTQKHVRGMVLAHSEHMHGPRAAQIGFVAPGCSSIRILVVNKLSLWLPERAVAGTQLSDST